MSLTKPIFPPVSEPAQSRAKICVLIHVSCCSCFSSQGYINPEEDASSTATDTQHWYLLPSLDSCLFFLPEARTSPNTLVYVQISAFEVVPPGAEENTLQKAEEAS